LTGLGSVLYQGYWQGQRLQPGDRILSVDARPSIQARGAAAPPSRPGLARPHPNAIMIHTPVHASWLNQVEIVFSIIQKKVLTPNDFPGTGTLSHALHAFVHRYNRTARPFNWKFTADDLTALLRRISQREQAATSQQPPCPGRLISSHTNLRCYPHPGAGVLGPSGACCRRPGRARRGISFH
jgi:hypothetical protein